MMTFAKAIPPLGVKANVRIMRPRRNDTDFLRFDVLFQNPLLHEVIQHHYLGSVAETESGTTFKQSSWQRISREPPSGYCFIWVQIHDPIAKLAGTEARKPCADK